MANFQFLIKEFLTNLFQAQASILLEQPNLFIKAGWSKQSGIVVEMSAPSAQESWVQALLYHNLMSSYDSGTA
jgi:hypothetical protein